PPCDAGRRIVPRSSRARRRARWCSPGASRRSDRHSGCESPRRRATWSRTSAGRARRARCPSSRLSRGGRARCSRPPRRRSRPPSPRSSSTLLEPVAHQRIPEGFAQRPEPLLVVTPLVATLRKSRLTHLLGARRADAARGAVVLEARPLEGQLAELEQPPHAPLEILDDVLVVDAQHPTREHGVPVLHELEVGAIVAGDVIDAVSELLTAGVELLQVPEAAGHRLAARIDDPGV